MKILHACPDYPPWALGGAPDTFRLLTEAWRSEGHEVVVTSSVPARLASVPPPSSPPRVERYELVDLPPPFREAAYFAPLHRSARRRLLRFVREEADGFDLVVAHGLLETLPRVLLGHRRNFRRAPLVSLQYGFSTGEVNPFLRSVSRALYATYGRRLASELETVGFFSDATVREWRALYGAVPRAGPVLLPFGIDTEALVEQVQAVTRDGPGVDRWLESRGIRRPFLLVLGRNDRAKGLDIALDAFRRVAVDRPSLSLVFAGDPSPLTAELHRAARQWGLETRVQFLGRVTAWERIALLFTSDVFLIPSRREGYGLNAVLARVTSKTTVATRTGAHDKILDGDPRFIIVPPGSSAAFAEGLRRALQQARGPVTLDPDQLRRFDIRTLARRLSEFGAR